MNFLTSICEKIYSILDIDESVVKKYSVIETIISCIEKYLTEIDQKLYLSLKTTILTANKQKSILLPTNVNPINLIDVFEIDGDCLNDVQIVTILDESKTKTRKECMLQLNSSGLYEIITNFKIEKDLKLFYQDDSYNSSIVNILIKDKFRNLIIYDVITKIIPRIKNKDLIPTMIEIYSSEYQYWLRLWNEELDRKKERKRIVKKPYLPTVPD